MKKLAVFSTCVGCIFAAATTHAIDLKQSKITQVVNDVQIISAEEQKQKQAAVNDIFSMPDLLRTGAASRAELVAQDQTVTRVGANTIFSFDPANRTLDLKQGSLLFHAPHGKGGGTIHTGSATASVLGTTLIVTTTPNGGFKVIALEGQVEVKFLNGLKQKLDPGQMTFVLPGANQLAPVIIFRLDELIQNSLLVNGFNQTLDSIPLIQDQVNKQNKLIHYGVLSDTGLYAGNDATPNQVEVLDINTISHGQPHTPSGNVNTAEAADATINQSSLTAASIPTPPNHVFTAQSFPLEGNQYFANQEFTGFIARNISVNTLSDAGTLTVDLSPYSKLSAFDIVAVNDFSIDGSVVFDGLASSSDLALIAGDQFLLTPGISISASVDNFSLSSPSSLTLDNVSISNPSGDIALNSSGDIVFKNNASVNANGNLTVNTRDNISVTSGSQLTGNSTVLNALSGSIAFDSATLNAVNHAILNSPTAINLNNSTINSGFVTLNSAANGSITLNNTTINAPGSIVAVCSTGLNITGTTTGGGAESVIAHVPASNISALNTDPSSGMVALTSSFGSVNVTGTSISAHYLTLNSGDGILLDASGQTVTATGTDATANFTARNTATVNNANLTSYAVVNIAANTVNLFDVAFSGTVNLKSLLGIWNNGSSMAGAVNDLGGVTYNGVLVNAENGSSGLLPGTGITVSTIH